MFEKYFITNEASQDSSKSAKPSSTEKKSKISADFEMELRKLYKIKSVIYTAFGVQVDFLKKPEQKEILDIIDARVRFKDKSIFIEF